MPEILPSIFYLPRSPETQSIQSVDRYCDLERSSILKNIPNSFLHILDAGSNFNSNHKRNLAVRKKWEDFVAFGHYTPLTNPAIFYYTIENNHANFSGFLCGITLASFLNKEITKHENTIPSRVDLMSEYLKTVKIQAEPVMVVHEDIEDILTIENSIPKEGTPILSFSIDQEKHSLWILNKDQERKLINGAKQVPYFHLADGHHRSASVEKISNDAANQNFLSVFSFLISKKKLVNHSFFWNFKKLPKAIVLENIKRIVLELNGTVVDLNTLPSETYPLLVAIKKDVYALPKSSLKSAITPNFICNTFLQSDKKIYSKLNYEPQINGDSLANLLRDKTSHLAFSMLPTSLDHLFRLASENKKLPAKSTYLFPKLFTGLIISS